ncbi:hypothetical protein AXF42_Ash014288 [Apostasia shenzhenica]|uniref:Uncharacterized protein n=1 Tax=Apostasia shenzhenica TaxID=1088818 RepID=A0A2I0B0P3_9ASPA|nr:hypothetical protein AXF42_Ash014288 [Apostasia shenzhenica]
MASPLLSHTVVLVLILCIMPAVMSKMPDDYTSVRGDQKLVEKICLIGYGVFDKVFGKNYDSILFFRTLDAGRKYDFVRYSMRFYAKFTGPVQGLKDITATVEISYALQPGFHVDLHIKNVDLTSAELLSVEFHRDGL